MEESGPAKHHPRPALHLLAPDWRGLQLYRRENTGTGKVRGEGEEGVEERGKGGVLNWPSWPVWVSVQREVSVGIKVR